jgi:molybdopterin-containing oxidoreductase family iron-sulfur binding subunit
MGSNTKYWKGLDELTATPEQLAQNENEFPAQQSVEEFLGESNLGDTSHNRRDFLKFLGFSVAAATLAACETPVVKSVPYVVKPEDVTPGVANWYASTYYDGTTFSNILIKTREGRPIHVKGNRDHGITKGGVNPRVVASVLPLYDSARLTQPFADGKKSTWSKVDTAIAKELQDIAKAGGKVRILSSTLASPSAENLLADVQEVLSGSRPGMQAAAPTEVLIDEEGNEIPQPEAATAVAMPAPPAVESSFKGGNADVEVVYYDAISYNGIRQANADSFGEAIIPGYKFNKAKTVVSLGADFLGTWLMANQYAPAYAELRNPEAVKAGEGEMSKHWQFESLMSITGANADERIKIKPSQEKDIASAILNGLGGGGAAFSEAKIQAKIDACVASLKEAGKGNALVVAGSNDKNIQLIVNAINEKLGSYGSTIDLDDTVNLYKSEDAKVTELANNVINGTGVDALFIIGSNPVYSLPNGKEFGEGLSKLKLSVSFSQYFDETSSKCQYIAPDHHFMEGWNDYQPTASSYGIGQPVIRPLHDTRAWQESMMVWTGMEKTIDGKTSRVYHDYIKGLWQMYGYPMAKDDFADEKDYWNWMVHNGGGSVPAQPNGRKYSNKGLSSAISAAVEMDGKYEVVLYQKNGMGAGEQANNPWLQEMPDPISTVTWDNYATMSVKDLEKEGLKYDFDQETPVDTIKVKVGERSIELPVFAQPGQAEGTIGVAYGYGRGEDMDPKKRTMIGKGAFATTEFGEYEMKDGKIKPIGGNAFRLGEGMANRLGGSLSKGGNTHLIAATQTHHTVMGRHSIIKETSLNFYVNGWKETNYANSKQREGFNPKHTLPVHEDVAGKQEKPGFVAFEPDGHIDANDRKPVSDFDLWNAHPVELVGHRWGMSIDLNSCIGCGSCLIACQSENNVPVVGKDEVRRVRIMHWLRIDRYYSSEQEEFVGTRKDEWDYASMEEPDQTKSPKVVFQPMMCHHCNHAPCETVCPVLATTHSNEGLNQMTYNRCIGTRYCANNCPYKVRRFNWFNYPSYKKFQNINPAQEDLGRMVLNPDVTVRTRGVMEKCSMCVQRIQGGKLEAKKAQREVVDGDINIACADSCPTNAITFGDLNNMKESYKEMNGEEETTIEREGSAVHHAANSDRSYAVLEEVGTKPNVFYKVKVRNIEDEFEMPKASAHKEEGGHGH